jgi:translation initiation factor IF-1
MVKNQFGGNKNKGQARKFVGAKPTNKLRIAESEGEIYAVVLKMNGNGMFHAMGIDKKLRLGFIRGKFSGKGKRDNMVEMGKWVLLGDREWSSASTGGDDKIKSDLLEVYNDGEKERLKSTITADWSVLVSNDNSKPAQQSPDKSELFDFKDNAEMSEQKESINTSDLNNYKETIVMVTADEQYEDVNIDDI